MPPKKRKSKRWSMFPSLHDEVSHLLEDKNLRFSFHQADTDTQAIEIYDTNIMGRFGCYNSECKSQGWGSKMIPITIRMYPGNEYNARVYHQRCKGCNELGRPKLDNSYAERVAYRMKKWKGITQETPHYDGKSKGPHDRSRCEGCKLGHCLQT